LAPGTVALRQTSATSAVPSVPRASPAAQRSQQGAKGGGESDPPLRRRALRTGEALGVAFPGAPQQRLIEQQARLRRVVMGDHDQRLDRLGVTGGGDDVDGLAAPAREAPQHAGTVLGLVEEARYARDREQPRGAAAPAQRKPCGGHAEQPDAGRSRRERPPRRLVLERHGDAVDRTEARCEPFGGSALARRAGRAVDRRQRLHDLAQHPLHVRIPAHRKHCPSPR
jgi:hypothetical protein